MFKTGTWGTEPAPAAQPKAINLARFAKTVTSRRDAAVFHVVLIKPTHYDADGYPIQWVKAAIPSNTLASVS